MSAGDDTVTLYEAVLPKKGPTVMRSWQMKRSELKSENFETTCEDGCRHVFSVDIWRVAKSGSDHDTQRMLRKMAGEHSDEEEEEEEEK